MQNAYPVKALQSFPFHRNWLAKTPGPSLFLKILSRDQYGYWRSTESYRPPGGRPRRNWDHRFDVLEFTNSEASETAFGVGVDLTQATPLIAVTSNLARECDDLLEDRADGRGWRTFVPSKPRSHDRGHTRYRCFVPSEPRSHGAGDSETPTFRTRMPQVHSRCCRTDAKWIRIDDVISGPGD